MERTKIFLICILFITVFFNCERIEEKKEEKATKISDNSRESNLAQTGTINLMSTWSKIYTKRDLVRGVAKEFEFSNQDISINIKYFEEIEKINANGQYDDEIIGKYVADMIKTGNIEFDIVKMHGSVYRFVAQELDDPDWGRKYLVDFGEIEGFKEAHKAFIIEDLSYRNQTGGIFVGPYIEGFYYALYYNRNVADRIGLKIKPYGMTFDDLLEYAIRVYQYNKNNGTEIAAFYEIMGWLTIENLFENLVKSEIGNIADIKKEELTDKKLAALLKGFRAFEELGKYDPLMRAHDRNIFNETQNIIFSDEALFFVNATWMYSYWKQVDKGKMWKMIPVELPVFQKVDCYLGGFKPAWAVLKDAPHRDNAIKLLMFWCRPKIAEKWVGITQNPTGLKTDLPPSDFGQTVYERFQHAMLKKYGRNLHRATNMGYLLGAENALLQEDVNIKLRELLEGRTTASEAYKYIIAKIDKTKG